VNLSEADIANFAKQEGLDKDAVRSLSLYLSYGIEYSKKVVGVEEFVNSPYYMNARNPDGSSVLYPEVMRCMIELNTGGYDEAVLTGAIGSGKTSLALYTQAFQLYLLSCLENPHSLFGLDASSEILIIFQSLNERIAMGVDYLRFKSMIDRSPYFNEYFPYDRSLKSELRFPNRIVVKAAATNVAGAIGQNLIGGILDEINFMAIVQKSAKAIEGGVYDQAKEIYDAIDRRRKSRFMFKGQLPGVLCLSSSKRYPGEFTDKKMQESYDEIKRTGKTTIYIYDKKAWDIKPEGTYSGGTFHVFVGDITRKPRILSPIEDSEKKDTHLIVEVPVEYRSTFEQDIIGAIRDVAGVSTLARYPFLIEAERVVHCFGKTKSILNLEQVDFLTKTVSFNPETFKYPEYPRWVHIDLGLTSDAAGIACGAVTGFTKMNRSGVSETMPIITLDFILRVVPPKNGEILFFKIRELLYKLRDHGLPVRWCSFDSFQSNDSLQLLRQKGFIAGQVSMDRDNVAYDFLKSAIYDDRLKAPLHSVAQVELLSLEKDPKTGKIDHPPHVGKDCSDAIAGVVFGLTLRREIWAQFDIPLGMIPESITEMAKKTDTKIEKKNPQAVPIIQ